MAVGHQDCSIKALFQMAGGWFSLDAEQPPEQCCSTIWLCLNVADTAHKESDQTLSVFLYKTNDDRAASNAIDR